MLSNAATAEGKLGNKIERNNIKIEFAGSKRLFTKDTVELK